MKDLSTPPSTEVRWRCRSPETGSTVIVKARTWVVARDEASPLLGCDRFNVECEMAMEPPTGIDVDVRKMRRGRR